MSCGGAMRLLGGTLAVLLGMAVAAVSPLATQREITAEVEIKAPPALVWKVLTDFPSYPIWNPYIYPATGALRPGGRLEVTLHPDHQTINFLATVLTVAPNRELRWGGRTLTSGLFDRVQTFTIEPAGPGRVRLVASERFTGLLIPFSGKLLGDTQRGLVMMAQALRARAELLQPPRGAP